MSETLSAVNESETVTTQSEPEATVKVEAPSKPKKTSKPKTPKAEKPTKAKKVPKASSNGHKPKGKTKTAPKGKAKGKAPKSGKARKYTPAERNVGKDGMSCLDAAHKVLKGRSKPMNTKELIEAMAEKKLWKSPGGATPAATLYTRLIKEIANKGKESRFKKVDKGLFAAK